MKFELTTEYKEWCGIKHFRIKAKISFNDVKAGDLGGFVAKEDCLAQVSGMLGSPAMLGSLQ